MATTAEVARMLDVDRDTVKLSASKFADHLSRKATPPKGGQRHFNESDLRLLALVFYYWEDDPDYEHIHAMLNSGDHEDDRFIEHARLPAHRDRRPGEGPAAASLSAHCQHFAHHSGSVAVSTWRKRNARKRQNP